MPRNKVTLCIWGIDERRIWSSLQFRTTQHEGMANSSFLRYSRNKMSSSLIQHWSWADIEHLHKRQKQSLTSVRKTPMSEGLKALLFYNKWTTAGTTSQTPPLNPHQKQIPTAEKELVTRRSGTWDLMPESPIPRIQISVSVWGRSMKPLSWQILAVSWRSNRKSLPRLRKSIGQSSNVIQ